MRPHRLGEGTAHQQRPHVVTDVEGLADVVHAIVQPLVELVEPHLLGLTVTRGAGVERPAATSCVPRPPPV